LAGLFRELLGGDVLALEGVEAVQERDGERARRAEPRVRRDVGEAMELEAALEAGEAERLAEDAMLDRVDGVDELGLRIGEANVVVEAPGDTHEAELVDRSGDEESAMLSGVAREVRAAAPEREANRCA